MSTPTRGSFSNPAAHLSLRSESELRSLGVKHDVLALQEDVAEDVDADRSAALQTTKAGAALLLKVHQGARDNSIVATNREG
jgi:hypothetical protein